MKDIVLVNPPLALAETVGEALADTGSKVPPLGLCTLAAVLNKEGFDADILDAAILEYPYEETVNKILKKEPRFVGITAVTISIYNAARLAEMLKMANKNIVIIIGGPHLTSIPEETMKRFPQFDIGVIGEGELTIVELIEALNNGKKALNSISGLILRDGKNISQTNKRAYLQNLDTLPFPAWELLPSLSDYYRPSPFTYKRLPATSLITSRGCPGECIFCDTSVFGHQWRGFSAEYVLEMIKLLYLKYGIRDINILDDVFVLNRRRLLDICRMLLEARLDLVWSCVARVDFMTKDILTLMADAGCWQVAYGIESGSEKILKFLNKGIKKDKIRDAVHWAHDAGIRVKGLFMMGNPLETEETIKETRAFIEELKIDDIGTSAFTPLPGSPFYKEASKFGTFEDDWQKMNLWNPVFVPFGLTKEIVQKQLVRGLRKE